MKLAFIIIPHETKMGSTKALLNNTINIFCKLWGGCTHYPVSGICDGHTDGLSCEKIEVALSSNPHEHELFINMAEEIATEAKVKELMVQHPNGEILFLEGAN